MGKVKITGDKSVKTKVLLYGGIFAVIGTIMLLVSRAATNVMSFEAESGSLTNGAQVVADTTAAGGSYVRLSLSAGPTPTPTPQPGNAFQPSAPYYAAFYYPWFKNASTDGSWGSSTWIDGDLGGAHNPPSNWFSNYLPDPNPNAFDPANELYSSNNYSTFKWQAQKMAEAKVEVAIGSWWGQGHKTDTAMNSIINNFMGRTDNPYPNLRWAFYYEKEGNVVNGTSDPSVANIVSDLNYINSTYKNSPYSLKVNGKLVMFVYGDATDGAATAARWKQANAQVGNSFYVVLKVYPGYATDPNQPDAWHQYAPAGREFSQGSDAYEVSPGFWRSGDPVRLGRDLPAFQAAVGRMVSSNAKWKLITTWNEWGEGSSVEPGTEVVQTNGSGTTTAKAGAAPFQNSYIQALADRLPALEMGLGNPGGGGTTPTPTPKPTTPTPVVTATPTPRPATPTPTPTTSTCGSGGSCTSAQVAMHTTATDCWVIVAYTGAGGNGTGQVFKLGSGWFGTAAGSHNDIAGRTLSPSSWCGKNISGTFNGKHSGGTRSDGLHNAIWYLANNGNGLIGPWAGV